MTTAKLSLNRSTPHWRIEARTGHYVWEGKGLKICLFPQHEPALSPLGEDGQWWEAHISIGPSHTKKEFFTQDTWAQDDALRLAQGVVEDLLQWVPIAQSDLKGD